MNSDTNGYPIVGRHPDVDLEKYTVKVHGREVIDYEKLKENESSLYQKIVDQEREWSRLDDDEEISEAK